MSKAYYAGFLVFVATTVLFIVSILTRYWIIKDGFVRGIFEICYQGTDSLSLTCYYMLVNSSSALVVSARQDYQIACSSLSIIASSLSIIFIWIAGIYMCFGSHQKLGKKIVSTFMIFGTLFIFCTSFVIWIVMLAKNLNTDRVITTSEIGWSLWCAVGSTGGYLIALVLFCMHRIDLALSPYVKRQDNIAESREYLQRF